MERSSILRQLMNQKNMKVADVSRESGIAYSTVKSILENGTEKASYINICKICSSLGITPDDLEKMVSDSMMATSSLSKEDSIMIEKYRTLDLCGQNLIDLILEEEIKRIKVYGRLEAQSSTIIDFRPKQDTGIIVLPYFPAGASAGTGLFILGNEAEDEIELPDLPEYEAADYAIDVKGRSMEPDYFDGDIALVNQYDEMSPGDVGVFIINGEVYVKELGNGELISHNHDYENIPIRESDNVVCMGKVIGKVI